MTIADRFLTATKTFLDEQGTLPPVVLRDWGELFENVTVVLDIESEPVEDEEVRGQYEIQATATLRCRSGVDDAERQEEFEKLYEALNQDSLDSPDEWALVVWMRETADRGIGDEELGVYEMLVGGGSWEISDDEVQGIVEFTVLAISVDLAADNFNV